MRTFYGRTGLYPVSSGLFLRSSNASFKSPSVLSACSSLYSHYSLVSPWFIYQIWYPLFSSSFTAVQPAAARHTKRRNPASHFLIHTPYSNAVCRIM